MTTQTPVISTAWRRITSPGRRSIMATTPRDARPPESLPASAARSSVLHLSLDVTELNHRQHNHDHHQYDRLRCRSSQIKTLDAVLIHLEHQDLGCLRRTALRGRIDDREG